MSPCSVIARPKAAARPRFFCEIGAICGQLVALYTEDVDPVATTVLWRLYRAKGPNKGDRMHAMVLPGGPPYTLAFFANEEMDRVENYDSMDLAVFRADEIKQGLVTDGWLED